MIFVSEVSLVLRQWRAIPLCFPYQQNYLTPCLASFIESSAPLRGQLRAKVSSETLISPKASQLSPE